MRLGPGPVADPLPTSLEAQLAEGPDSAGVPEYLTELQEDLSRLEGEVRKVVARLIALEQGAAR